MALGKANLESERYIKSLKPEERYKLTHKDQYEFGSHAIALLSFKRALTLNPGDADLHYLLGETYDEMNDGRNASAYVEGAKRLYEKKGDRKMAAKAGEYAQSLQKKYALQHERKCKLAETLC
jgi:tetratricopeptide (TPR) repeat protein